MNRINEEIDKEDFYQDLYEYTASDLLYEFLADKEKGIKTKKWTLIPAQQYKNLLVRYMDSPQMARIPHNVVNRWFKDIICHNSVCLEYITEFAGHSYSFPFDDFYIVFDNVEEDYEYETASDYLEKIGFYDWCKLPDESDAWSDFGLEPIFKIINEYPSKSDSAEEILILINRILDIYHCRGDLASAFIEGGSKTCYSISNESMHEGTLSNSTGRNKNVLYQATVKRITKPQLNAIIAESIKKVINESGGSIVNDNWKNLSDYIYKKAIEARKNGNKGFNISKEEFEKFGCEIPEGGNNDVVVKFTAGGNYYMEYSSALHQINIDGRYMNDCVDDVEFHRKSFFKNLMHEFTHGYNGRRKGDTESGKNYHSILKAAKFAEDDFGKLFNRALYLFTPTEMNARLSEFDAELREEGTQYKNPQDTVLYSSELETVDMRDFVDALKNKEGGNYQLYQEAMKRIEKDDNFGHCEDIVSTLVSYAKNGKRAVFFKIPRNAFNIKNEKEYWEVYQNFVKQAENAFDEFKKRAYKIVYNRTKINTNENMKTAQRINERQLRAIVAESVKKVLNENNLPVSVNKTTDKDLNLAIRNVCDILYEIYHVNTEDSFESIKSIIDKTLIPKPKKKWVIESEKKGLNETELSYDEDNFSGRYSRGTRYDLYIGDTIMYKDVPEEAVDKLYSQLCRQAEEWGEEPRCVER